MYLAGAENEANRDDAYYSMLDVMALFQNSRAITRAWMDAAVIKGSGEANDTTINADTLAGIDQITTHAIDMLSSFTNVLSGNEPMAIGQIIGTFDAITSALASIEAVIDGSSQGRKEQQA
ncbi:hypothetical protein [Methylobacter sp.]|uniref:hypothetical protein n=1 Tax=Methylobacter sp. TaxID=2051955 RepID=UPI002FDCB7F1